MDIAACGRCASLDLRPVGGGSQSAQSSLASVQPLAPEAAPAAPARPPPSGESRTPLPGDAPPAVAGGAPLSAPADAAQSDAPVHDSVAIAAAESAPAGAPESGAAHVSGSDAADAPISTPHLPGSALGEVPTAGTGSATSETPSSTPAEASPPAPAAVSAPAAVTVDVAQVCGLCGFTGPPLVFRTGAEYEAFRAASPDLAFKTPNPPIPAVSAPAARQEEFVVAEEEMPPDWAPAAAAPQDGHPGRSRGGAIVAAIVALGAGVAGGLTAAGATFGFLGAETRGLAVMAAVTGLLGLVLLGVAVALVRIARRLWRGTTPAP